MSDLAGRLVLRMFELAEKFEHDSKSYPDKEARVLSDAAKYIRDEIRKEVTYGS